MSQLPRPGQGGKAVKTTITKTSGIPGSNRSVTVSKTTTTELVPCGKPSTSSSVGVGVGQSGARASGLRAPGAGIRPPGGIPQRPSAMQPPRTQSGTQTSRPTCPAARAGGAPPPSRMQPPAARTSGTRLPAPGVSARPSGSRLPAASGPCGGGAARPAAASGPCGAGSRPPSAGPGVGSRPSGSRLPAASGPCGGAARPSGMQAPRPSGMQAPRAGPCGGAAAPRAGGIPRTASGRSIARPSGTQLPRAAGPPPPVAAESVTVEPKVQRQLMEKSIMKPNQRVISKSMKVKMPVVPEIIVTPVGPQPVLQQTVLEQRVERDESGERVIKNLGITDRDPCTGAPKTLVMGIQQLNPKYPREQGREVVGITSKVSITADYATISQTTQRAVTEPLSAAAELTAAEIAKMVDDEKEDVDNTLRIFPPDMVTKPGRHELKQRLQQLRLNSESVALLEQSIIHPEPTADDAQAEPSPEAMAAMMHTVEKGVPPQSTPDQVFNSLFSETSNEKYIKMSSVAQGPLQDVVVPTEIPKEIHQAVVTQDMEKLTERLNNITNAEDVPYVDIFTTAMDDGKKSPAKGKNKTIEFPVIADEKSLWVNADLAHLVNVVGAEPAEVLDPADVEQLQEEGTLDAELAKGLQYFVDADPVQYMSRVQLRGTQPPCYFPGYIVALPEFGEVVRLARTPDEVFASAWKSARPKYFGDESMQSMLF